MKNAYINSICLFFTLMMFSSADAMTCNQVFLNKSLRGLNVASMKLAINKALKDQMTVDKVFGLSYSLFDSQGVVISGGLGSRSQSAYKQVHPVQSTFRVASVSKIMVSMAAMKLVEQKRLNLDSGIMDLNGIPFVEFLKLNETPERLTQWQRIKVRDLMNHQSGISKDQAETQNPFFNFDGVKDGQFPSHDSLLPSLLKIQFLFEPNKISTGMKYSNMGPNLLARIVEAVNADQLNFEAYVAKYIFSPLGMSNSAYNVNNPSQLKHLSGGFSSQATGRREIPQVTQVGSYDGSIGVASSSHDLGLLGSEMLNQLNGRGSRVLTNPQLISQYYSPVSGLTDKMAWAQGPHWVTLSGKSNDSTLWVGHMGTGPDTRSVLLVAPELGIGVSLIANAPDINRDLYVQKILDIASQQTDFTQYQNSHALTQKARQFLQAFKPPNATPEATNIHLLSKEKLKHLTGTYLADISGKQKIELDNDGNLIFYGQKLILVDKDKMTFRFPEIAGPSGILFNKEPVQFIFDKNGNVISIRVAEGKFFVKLNE